MSSLPEAERSYLYSRDASERIDFTVTSDTVTKAFESFRHGGSVDRALKTDLRYYLADDILTLTDRLSMWHSLELRVPYLDHRFVEEVMTIPSWLKIRAFNQKYVLKRVAARWLPQAVINHRKQGFEAPMGRWFRGPLRELLHDALAPAAIASGRIFDVAEVERLKDEHLTGRSKHSKVLFSLMMFQMWQHGNSSRQLLMSAQAAHREAR